MSEHKLMKEEGNALKGGMSIVKKKKRVSVVYTVCLYSLSNTVKLLTSQWKITELCPKIQCQREKENIYPAND